MPKLKLSLNLKFIGTFIVVTAGFVLLAVYAITTSLRPTLEEQALKSAEEIIDISTNEIIKAFEAEVSEVKIISNEPEIRALVRSIDAGGVDPETNLTSEYWKSYLAEHFTNLIEKKQIYDQIRYLNEEGNEIVRVDMEGGKAVIIPDQELQNKKDRYYFSEGMILNEGECYISQIDLNREGKQSSIEFPIKPMIRYVAPVFNMQNERKGAIVTNVLADKILSTAKDNVGLNRITVIDNKGFYLLHEDENKLWGSPRDLDTGENFQKDFPEYHQKIEMSLTGSAMTDEGVLAYSPVKVSSEEEYSLIVLKSIPTETSVGPIIKAVANRTAIVGSTYFVFFILVSYLIIRFFLRPLVKLTTSVSEVKEGNILINTGIKSNDEVGQLARTFEQMSKRLNDLYHNLESKVDERTKDLKQFHLAVENASDLVVITDIDGVVMYANPASEKITGYSIDESHGKKAGQLWGGLMSEDFYEKLWQTIKIDKKVFVGELKNKRKNGEEYDALASISPVLDDNDNVLFFVSIERDISKEKELDRIKDEFVSIASHELRTPLTAIDGIVSMMRDGEYGEINKEIRKGLDDVNTASERLITLVNDLLSLSRIQAGRLKYELSEFGVEKPIKDVCDLFSVIVKKKGLELKTESGGEIVAQADMGKFKQILNNLLNNALKFTDSGYISVSFKEEGDNVNISIQDTGCGISKKDMDKLFGKFQQASNQSGRPPGTGLGLHLSREMTRKMGGDLWIAESEVGRGSTFVISLPKKGTKRADQVSKNIADEARKQPDQKSDRMEKV